MGQPTQNFSPYDQDVKQMVEQNAIQYMAYQAIKPHEMDKWERLMNSVGDTIGWGWVFASFVIGIIMVGIVVFKTYIKKILGEWLKLANKLVNG